MIRLISIFVLTLCMTACGHKEVAPSPTSQTTAVAPTSAVPSQSAPSEKK